MSDLNNVAKVGEVGVAYAKTVVSSVGKQSLARMAKESIFQFPVIVSAAIDTDEIGTISKSVEQTYASMVVSVMSIEGVVDRSKYKSTKEYLKKFHTNNGTPGRNIGALGIESVMESLWDIVDEQVDMESVNDIYAPYKFTHKTIEERLEVMHNALEAKDFPLDDDSEYVNKHPKYKNFKNTFSNTSVNGVPVPNTKANTNDTDEVGANKSTSAKDTQIFNKAANAMVRNDKLAVMEPTLVNITLMNFNDSAKWSQTITLGIKSMVRMVKSNVMIANMIEAGKDQAIFKFIAWTKGEYKLHDLLFGFKKYKEMGKGVAKGDWLKVLKKRRSINNVYKLVGYRLLPNCTIIMTDAEVEQIKVSTGIDFRQSSTAKKVIDKYFLLGLGIYDTERKVLDVMYDSDQAYSSYALRALESSVKKEIILASNNKY